jgi:hypothetical protein
MKVGTDAFYVAPQKYRTIAFHGITPANDPNTNAVQFVFSAFWL